MDILTYGLRLRRDDSESEDYSMILIITPPISVLPQRSYPQRTPIRTPTTPTPTPTPPFHYQITISNFLLVFPTASTLVSFPIPAVQAPPDFLPTSLPTSFPSYLPSYLLSSLPTQVITNTLAATPMMPVASLQ